MVNSSLRPFVPALYLVGVVMVVIALGDFLGNVWPFRPTAVDWRYSALGILSGFLVTPLFGLLLLAAGAALGGHGKMLRALGVVGILIAAFLLASIALFALDALQVRQQAAPGAKWVTAVSSLIAGAKYLLGSVVALMIGQGAFQAARAGAPSARSRGQGGLVVGAS